MKKMMFLVGAAAALAVAVLTYRWIDPAGALLVAGVLLIMAGGHV